MTGMVAATASPALSYEIGQQFKKHNAEGIPAHILAHAVLGAAVAAAGDNNALGAIDNSKKEAKDLRYCFHATIPNLCHVPKHAYK